MNKNSNQYKKQNGNTQAKTKAIFRTGIKGGIQVIDPSTGPSN